MTHTAARIRRAVLRASTRPHASRLATRIHDGVREAGRRPDRGDISITTVIIWVAAVTGALLIAGTIAVVIAKYNGNLAGI